jgi:ornithine carbamoyltransferase
LGEKNMKHLLKLLDLEKGQITHLLDLADKLKKEQKAGVKHHLLAGKTLGMIFEKSSTRTRVSFEVGMFQLGGHALYLNANDLQIGRGEPLPDTARNLSRYLDGLMIRTFKHQVVEDFASYGSIPVINGLTDTYHPCQVLADLQNIREKFGKLEGLKLAFLGDGSDNMANSLVVGGLKMGMSVAVASPKKYALADAVLDYAKGKDFMLTEDVFEAAKNADVLVTDVFTSMGQEADAEKRLKELSAYQLNHKVFSVAKRSAIVQHCLPAKRGQEITHELFEEHATHIFDEAENRLHAQKAVLVTLLS